MTKKTTQENTTKNNPAVAKVVARNRTVMVKAFEAGKEALAVPAQSSQSADDRSSILSKTGAIEPPYEPETLAGLFEVSNSLRQNIDAYAVNIDSFGHRFEPVINLDSEDAPELVQDALIMERLAQMERNGEDVEEFDIDDPSDEEIKVRIKQLRRKARIEKARLTAWFQFAAQGESFASLRKRTRQDKEVTGNAYWEVLRNRKGKIVRLVFVPSWTVRLRHLHDTPVEVQERVMISSVTFGKIPVKRQFRTFVQLADTGTPVYFREFGDPRVVSRATGEFYPDEETLRRKEPNTPVPANELIHFSISSPRSPYGVPRWIGTLISVLGSRAAEEVNFFYFENKAVPPMAILVSGGRLSKSSVPKIEDFIENNIKGRRNFHKILILEAVTPNNRSEGPSPQRPMIEIKPLMDAQQQDALFQDYDQNNQDKVGSSFRVPRLLRGESKDFNRATALAALRMAEEQVFQPERDEFDFFVNSSLLPELDATFWQYKSNSPLTRDPETMGKIVAELVKQGVLTPAEARILAGDIFNRDFEIIKEPWTKQPITFTLAGIQTGQAAPVAPTVADKADLSIAGLGAAGELKPAQGNPPKIPSISSDTGKDTEEIAAMLLRIRSKLAIAAGLVEKDELAQMRSDDETITIEVTSDQMSELIDREQPET